MTRHDEENSVRPRIRIEEANCLIGIFDTVLSMRPETRDLLFTGNQLAVAGDMQIKLSELLIMHETKRRIQRLRDGEITLSQAEAEVKYPQLTDAEIAENSRRILELIQDKSVITAGGLEPSED